MSRPSTIDATQSGDPKRMGPYLAGARASVPFALATLVLGVSFGVLARFLGWGVVAPVVFSVVAFSGSAQFAVAAVLGAGALAVLGRAGLLGDPPASSLARTGVWVLGGAFALAGLVNLAGRTRLERLAFAPTCLLLAGLFAVVAA